jgi:lysophospholipase L1-like esterase
MVASKQGGSVANNCRIVAIGDSIVWGQGLLPDEKFLELVRVTLLPKFPGGIKIEPFAHSGAVIGARSASGTPQVGEVPASRLSIIEQCDNFANAPENVDLVILNGGINDVGIANILNPLSLIPSLHTRVAHACHDGMLVLLKKVTAKFTKPTCKILVTGYYSILSAQSDPLGVIRLLSLFGIAVPEFFDNEFEFINPVLSRCAAFYDDSTKKLKQAIADAGDPRIKFVPTGFTDANSMFVPGTSLLWGLDEDMGPQDPVAAARRPLCDNAHRNALEIPERELCYRASAGHPNVQGAIQFSKQVLAAL